MHLDLAITKTSARVKSSTSVAITMMRYRLLIERTLSLYTMISFMGIENLFASPY